MPYEKIVLLEICSFSIRPLGDRTLNNIGIILNLNNINKLKKFFLRYAKYAYKKNAYMKITKINSSTNNILYDKVIQV